ncbi:MAG: hypothetical protein CMO01_06810 [Thalassobius sp.]|nr:hypothetical protein [Thalassovita sp.]
MRGLAALLLCFLVLWFYASLNHGHLLFRLRFTEDYIIWGIALFSGLFGILSIFISIRKYFK